MVVLLLAAAFPLMQSVSVTVGKTTDSTKARINAQSDSARRARERREEERGPPRRIPLTPELERSAFRDPQARELLLKARAARLEQDSALLSYDATAYQRL